MLIVLGVPLVLPLAVLTFLGAFFPIVGATVAGALAALVALVDGGLTTALFVVAATLAIQQLEGNVLQPLILGRAVHLHPLVTAVSVAAGLLLGGVAGAFLAVPFVAAATQVGNYYRTRPDPTGTGKPPTQAAGAPLSPPGRLPADSPRGSGPGA